MPPPPTSDPTSDLFVGVAVFLGQQNGHILIADNTITGPGASLHLRRVQDVFAPDQAIRTAGIWQNDGTIPAGTFGRVSNNVVSGLDLCIQSTSDFGVVSNNTTNRCGFGIILSNDTNDGVTTVHGNVVTGNDLRGNQVGLWMASATQNVISLNDARNNSVTGLLFLANANGANSDDNTFVLNQGSKQGVSGNQGQSIVKLRE
jgi:parallel beta-helix repeat protein